MTTPNRRLQLEKTYTASDNPSEFESRGRQVVDKISSTEVLLHQGYVNSPDKFDTEEMFSLTIDGYPEQLTKQTFKVRIERAKSEDRCLLRVSVEWFGVNTEDIAEMEKRGTEILQVVQKCLQSEFNMARPTSDVKTASRPGKTH